MSSGVIRKVDIAICTWNRDALLAQTLDSVIKLRVPDSVSLCVLIVDNNSTDHTSSVIQSFAATFGASGAVVSLSQPQQGHTFCRNLAIESAKGDLILWTDDDVILAPDWVERYVIAAESEPESVFWGSVIEPMFQEDPPDWIEQNWENIKGCFAHRDLGDQAIGFSPSELPYGANFGIRTKVQKEFLFATELGRRGESVFGEDELDVFRRILAAGHKGSWIPGAIVQHVIPRQRVTEKFVYDYFVGQGRALVAKGNPWHKDLARLNSEARSQYLSYKMKRMFADSKTWVSHMIRSALAKGQFEALQHSS